MRHSMFMIEEYIQNDDTELTNSKNTTIILSKSGDSFFKAHIENRNQYQMRFRFRRNPLPRPYGVDRSPICPRDWFLFENKYDK